MVNRKPGTTYYLLLPPAVNFQFSIFNFPLWNSIHPKILNYIPPLNLLEFPKVSLVHNQNTYQNDFWNSNHKQQSFTAD